MSEKNFTQVKVKRNLTFKSTFKVNIPPPLNDDNEYSVFRVFILHIHTAFN